MSVTSKQPWSDGFTWDWSHFALGLVFALPAVIVAPFNEMAGLALAVGVLPAAAFNLPAMRRARRVIPVIGVISALSLLVGSMLTQVPVLAVVAVFAFAVSASLWSRTHRVGALALMVALPLMAIGLSIGSVTTAVGLAGLMVLGSLYAWAVSLLWPNRRVDPPPPRPTPPPRAMLVYGILLGLAGAIAAGVGYALQLEHVGWAPAAALLVMRPARNQLVLRSIGRAASVLVGALAAAALAAIAPAALVVGVVVGVALGALTATTASRWYVAPGFTTFVALTLIIHAETGVSPGDRFIERTLETLLGVGLALLFGAVVPAGIAWMRKGRTPA